MCSPTHVNFLYWQQYKKGIGLLVKMFFLGENLLCLGAVMDFWDSFAAFWANSFSGLNEPITQSRVVGRV